MRVLALIALALTVACAVAVEVRGPSATELMVMNRSHHLALAAHSLWGYPVSQRPVIQWNYDDDWDKSAYADCRRNTMILDWAHAHRHLQLTLDVVLPHEYGHFVHCFVHGEVGRDPHGPQWAAYVRQLGGDPEWGSDQFGEPR